MFFCLFYLQYSSIDTSPLSQYVMHPFWNTTVKVSFFYCFLLLFILLHLTRDLIPDPSHLSSLFISTPQLIRLI